LVVCGAVGCCCLPWSIVLRRPCADCELDNVDC